MVAVYGGAGILPEPLDYSIFCSLWFNLPRVRLQKSWDVKTGMVMANSRTPLPTAIYDAQALTPELAQKLQWESNKKRAISQQLQKLGF